MTYSTTEKTAALLEFARSDPLSGGGIARSLEMMQALLVQEPDAVYDVVLLAALKAKRSVTTMLELTEELTDAAADIAAKPQALEAIPNVSKASSIARTLDSSVTSRGVVGRTGQRLSTALKDAAKELTGGIRKATRVRMSYDEARAVAAGNLNTITSSWDDLEELLLNITSAQTVLNSSSLRAKLGVQRVQRIRLGVEDVEGELESLSASERSKIARPAALRLLAADVELQDLLRPLASGSTRLHQPPAATATYRLQAAGTGDAPVLEGTVSAPWPIESGSEDMTVDVNGTSAVIDVVGAYGPIQSASVKATVDGSSGIALHSDITTPDPIQSAVGPFAVAAGTGDQLYIRVNSKTYRVTLTSGAGITATTLAADVNTDATIVADGVALGAPPVTASNVGGRLHLVYTHPSPPTDYGARVLEVVTQQGGYTLVADALVLTPWRQGVSPNTVGTRSTGWTANNELRVQANDDPNLVTVTLPDGAWPDFLVPLGTTISPNTVVYAIDQAAQTAVEDFTAENDGGFLRIFSGLEGEGSIITIRTDGVDSDSGRCVQSLGLAPDQEDRQEDIPASTVVGALRSSPNIASGARVKEIRTDYVEGVGEVASSTSIELAAEDDPTGSWPSASELKVAVSGPDGSAVFQISSYSWAAATLTINVSRRIRDAVASDCRITVYKSVLRIESTDTSTSGLLRTTGDPTTPIGLSTTAVLAVVRQLRVSENSTVFGWRTLDLTGRHVRAQDVIRLSDATTVDTVTAVEESTGLITISTGVTATYVVSTAGFTIVSAAALAYKTLQSAIEACSGLGDAIAATKKAFARLYVAKSVDAMINAKAKVTTLRLLLEALQAPLSAYAPPQLPIFRRALTLLTENGLDRARLLLTNADVQGFVAIDGDGSTVEALRKAASAVSYQDLGAQRDNRQNIPRAGWVDAVDPNNNFDDYESEDDEVFTPTRWGDEEI